jgi:AAA15 family ATPase/GTPase
MEQELVFGDDAARNVTALFGPNSGGKSNTARAILILFDFIFNSANANAVLPYDPFLLKEGSDKEASSFEIRFAHGERYFTYSVTFDRNSILSEALKERSPKINKMKTVFLRDDKGNLSASADKYGFGKKLLKKTRKETLLITKAREDNNAYANIVFDLMNFVNVVPGDAPNLQGFAVELLRQNPALKEKTIQLLRNCDFSIQDIAIEDVPIPDEVIAGLPFTEEMKQSIRKSLGTAIRAAHVIRNDDRKVIGARQFDLMSQESMGTRKFFEMAVPIADALEYGKTLYIDEFGAYLHPTLANAIIKLFKSESNKKNARLILNSHNTSIMSQTCLAREDIVFVEKNLSEESVIVPLFEKSVRPDESFEKRYREGLYGGIPIIRVRNSLK